MKVQGLGRRFWRYQAERFPLAGTTPMVLVFTASAAAYSRLARGEAAFISWPVLGIGSFTALVCFAMLRILDEHKDAAVDALTRPELPVPRGLVSLAELRGLGWILCLAALALNAAFLPRLLPLMALVAIWAALMAKEFFAPRWLRARPLLYMLSHMLIMPLIDIYGAGLDWANAGEGPPSKLFLFLAVTFSNGMIIEVGRKLRAPSAERQGVDTYSSVWGFRKAALFWLGSLALTTGLALTAGEAIGLSVLRAAFLVALACLLALPALAYLRSPEGAWGRRVEHASGIWTIVMYLWLGLWPLFEAG